MSILVDAFVYGKEGWKKSGFPVPGFENCRSNLGCSASSTGKLVFYTGKNIAEYDCRRFHKVLDGEFNYISSAQYVYKDFLLVEYDPTSACDDPDFILFDDGSKQIHVALPVVDIPGNEEDYILIDEQDWRNYRDDCDDKGYRFTFYNNHLYTYIMGEIFCLENGAWNKDNELAALLEGKRVRFLKNFPDHNMLFVKTGGSALAYFNGKTVNLNDLLNLDFNMTDCDIFMNKVYICTRTRGLIEFSLKQFLNFF